MMRKFSVIFLVYLFAYLEVSPVIAFATAKQRRSIEYDSDLEQARPRNKRFFGCLIAIIVGVLTATAGGVVSHQINEAIRKSNAPEPNNKEKSINIFLNHNKRNAAQLKQELAKIDASLGQAIQIGSEDFQCNADYCRKMGDVTVAVGFCRSEICNCEGGVPAVFMCKGGKVYDPIHEKCDYANNLEICGN